MPAPPSSNALTLGRPVYDLSLIKDDGHRIIVEQQMLAWMGAGCPAGARSGDTQYQALYARYVAGEWFIYAGKPSDPMNPDLVTSPFSGSTSIAVADEAGASLGSFNLLRFLGAGVTAADGGGGECDITIPGGGGTYTEGNGIDIDGSNVVSAELATNRGLEFDGSGIAVNIGNGLEMATNDIVVKAYTLIDVDANGVAVDFTEGAGYSGVADQYWRNNAGTFQWATLPDWSVIAGTYIDVSGQTVNVDLTEVADYSAGATQLLGHVSSVIAFDTVGDWLKTLPNYDVAKKQVLTHDLGTVEWNDVDAVLNWLGSYNSALNQSIGHDAAGATVWQEDGTACP